MDKINAPWTLEQAAALNGYQLSGVMHPFTCPRSHITIYDESLGYWREPEPDEDPHPWSFDHATLVAYPAGWACPMQSCDYTQFWAWEWMIDGWQEPKRQLDKMLQDGMNEIVRTSEEAGLYSGEVSETRLRREQNE